MFWWPKIVIFLIPGAEKNEATSQRRLYTIVDIDRIICWYCLTFYTYSRSLRCPAISWPLLFWSFAVTGWYRSSSVKSLLSSTTPAPAPARSARMGNKTRKPKIKKAEKAQGKVENQRGRKLERKKEKNKKSKTQKRWGFDKSLVTFNIG